MGKVDRDKNLESGASESVEVPKEQEEDVSVVVPDSKEQGELSGIERLYKSLGIKYDPARILGRLK